MARLVDRGPHVVAVAAAEVIDGPLGGEIHLAAEETVSNVRVSPVSTQRELAGNEGARRSTTSLDVRISCGGLWEYSAGSRIRIVEGPYAGKTFTQVSEPAVHDTNSRVRHSVVVCRANQGIQ